MAETTIVFIGVSINIPDEEVTLLEDRSHPILLASRRAGLDHYWGSFDALQDEYILIVGRILGKVGHEDASKVSIAAEDLTRMIIDVPQQLRHAGLTERSTLMVIHQPDS